MSLIKVVFMCMDELFFTGSWAISYWIPDTFHYNLFEERRDVYV